MKTFKKNLLVTLADEKYLDFAKQLFSSAYFNSGWEGDYMLLAHQIPDYKLDWFREKGIFIKHCNPLAESMPGRWPVTQLSKFYLFSEEFKKWDKVIYLDADLIVNFSLNSLLSVKKMASINTRINIFFKRKFRDTIKIKKIEALSEWLFKLINPNEKMFCAGIFAFNTDIISKNSFQEIKKLIEIIAPKISGIEVIFNIYFAGKFKELSPTYCFTFDIVEKFEKKFNNIQAVTAHFINVDENRIFRPYQKIWQNNFDNAEAIDLNNRPAGKFISKSKIKYNYLKILIIALIILIEMKIQKIKNNVTFFK